MGAKNDSQAPANPIRTTHLDSGWVDDPTLEEAGADAPAVLEPNLAVPEGGDATRTPTAEEGRFESLNEETFADGPKLPPPPPRAAPNKRVLGKPSVPPPPNAGPRQGPPPRRFDGPRAPAPPEPPRMEEPSVEVPETPPGPRVVAASGPPAGPASEPPRPMPPMPASRAPDLAPSAAPHLVPATAQAAPLAPLDLLPPAKEVAAGGTVRLGEALGQRVRVGPSSLPAWTIAALVVIGFGGLTALLGALVGLTLGSSRIPSAPEVASSAPVASAAPANDAPPVTEMAAAGDPAAMKELASKPTSQRTIDESIALANGGAIERKAALAALATELTRNPKLAEDPEVIVRLRGAAEDIELSRDALRILASLPGPQSADIVYQTWVGTSQRTRTTELAEELVYGKEVRSKASPALAVALDLRRAATCEQVAEILPRAVEHGDRRALHLLGRLVSRRGCGKGKREDCYPCLRDGNALADAIKAARERQPPAL